MWNWPLFLGLTGERIQLHEELSLQEGALREILKKRISEVEELKRAQQLRVDEISVQKLRESYDTIQRLNSQMQELQERVNCMNDSGEFQDTESNTVEKFSYSQSTSSRSKSSIYAKPRQTLATWYMEFVWITLKRFWQSTSCVRFITDTLSRKSSLYLWLQGLQVRLQCREWGTKKRHCFPFLFFLIFKIFNSVRKETIDCDSNALPEGVDFKNYRGQKSLVAALRGTCESWQIASEKTRMSTFSSKPLSEKIGEKGSRRRTSRAVRQRNILDRSAGHTEKVIAQLHLAVNLAKSVLWGTSRLRNSQARSRNKKWQQWCGKVEYS